ncbi:MAG: tyrosine-type recombinase/integrase [Helicobacteraceae bacterium]|nr:tyrosine-type recombinase/integrase [Helicobacteraceae bacterium]
MRPKHSTKDRQPLGANEFKRLMEITLRDKKLQRSTKLKLLRAFTLLRLTGCRISEIIEFTLDDLKHILKHTNISLDNNNKTNSARLLRFSENGLMMIKNLEVSDVTNKLFYKNASSSSMSVAVFTRTLNEQLAKVLGELYTTHSFRAGLITDAVRATGNVKIAQAIAGHSSVKTTLGYIKASNEDIYEALGKVI